LSGRGGLQDDPALRAVVPDTLWTPAPYAANWADFGAGEATGAYRRDALGWVALKGLAKKAVALVANDTILTLPATGLVRPATEHIFACASAAGYTEIRVNPNGTVFIVAGGSAVFTSLAGIRFDPAT
jgi:hypothetical protein